MMKLIRRCYWQKNTKQGGGTIAEILSLIARIIIIIAKGVSAIEATVIVAEKSGINFDALWDFLPNKWK